MCVCSIHWKMKLALKSIHVCGYASVGGELGCQDED